jgi:HEAT repeat protein
MARWIDFEVWCFAMGSDPSSVSPSPWGRSGYDVGMKRPILQSLVMVVFLAGCSRHRSTEALIEDFASADEESRIQAAHALARRGEEVVPDLIEALDDERPLVRDWAIRTLWEMGPGAEAATQRLIQALDDTDHDVRRSATCVLAANPSALPLVLLKIKDPAPQVRTASIRALSVHPQDPGAIIPAIAGALHDPDETVRAAAATALGRFPKEATATLPALLAALDDGSPSVRGTAAGIIGEMGPAGRPALDRLVKALNDDVEQGVRQAAAGALAQFGAEALPPLIDALRHRDRFTRVTVVEALGYMGSTAKGAIPALKEAVQEGDPLVVAAAEEAIRRIEGAIAVDQVEAREKAEAEAEAKPGR